MIHYSNNNIDYYKIIWINLHLIFLVIIVNTLLQNVSMTTFQRLCNRDSIVLKNTFGSLSKVKIFFFYNL